MIDEHVLYNRCIIAQNNFSNIFLIVMKFLYPWRLVIRLLTVDFF